MRSRRRALALAGDLFVVVALLAVSGCRQVVGSTDRAPRATPDSVTLHFPDPKAYIACVTSDNGRCDASTPAPPGPVKLELFRTRANGVKGGCTVREVAGGADIVRRVQNRTSQPGLERTEALARRGLAIIGASSLLDSRADPAGLSNDNSVFLGSTPGVDALTGVTAVEFRRFYDAILGSARGEGALQLTAEAIRTFTGQIHEASAYEAWEPLYLCGLNRMSEIEQTTPDSDEMKAAGAFAEAALFLGPYFKAYFRGGQFLDFAINPKEAKTSLVAGLKSRLGLGDTEAHAVAKKVLDEVSLGSPGADGNVHLLTKLPGGFVTRGGNTLAFPGVDVTITPFAASPVAASKIDLSAVAADVVRVFIEAVGDSLSGVPGVLQSSGCSTQNQPGKPLLGCFAPGKVTVENFAAINAQADAVDGMVGHAVGSAVRGASWFSLNNEMLAKVIETAAAAIARKAAEKVAWCYYDCRGPATRERLLGVPLGQELTIQLEVRR